jgi:hypothetical protein
MGNKLVINFNGDYGKGVEVASDFVIDGTMRIHGSDLILDGRSRLNSPDALFRALVDMGHKLVINFNGDYGQGVQVASDLEVGGKLRSSGADCAEQFDLAADAAAEPGSVMVIGAEGRLEPCTAVYDSRVAGVVSGAGGLKTAIVLNDRGGRRAAIALIGSVYCKCDARDAPISAGDLLTTSAMVGHAMRADDASRRFGAVIGKALKPLSTGTGLLPILVSPR